MSEVIIKVENVGKMYNIGHQRQESYTALRDVMANNVKSILHKTKELFKGQLLTEGDTVEEFWALKDVSFDIQQGDSVGIIGRNGAGKSTLLKILSRITEPTTGKITINGNVASLLEVGTGFHPELSGRENIFLNGAILGMSREDIRKQFDEIVAFAEIEKFLDTPVKRYSSGMYVRLAFAVAAHLKPDVLIVDEVLAVGDAEFQKKCLGKMRDVSTNDGRTVLFVSHNMAAINQLCNKAISLKKGRIYEHGETTKVVSNYLHTESTTDAYINLSNVQVNRSGNKKVQFTEICLKSSSSEVKRVFSIGESLHLNFTMKFNNPNEKFVTTSIELKTSDGFKIANMADVDSGFKVKYDTVDVVSYEVVLEDIRLYPDTYYLSFWAGDKSSTEAYDFIEDCISFEVIDGGALTSRRLPRDTGLLFLTPIWNINK